MVDVKRVKLCLVQKQIGSGDERLFSVRGYVCLDKSVIKKERKKKENKDMKKSFVIIIINWKKKSKTNYNELR